MTERSSNDTPPDRTPRSPDRRDWFAPPQSQSAETPDDASDITYSGPLPRAAAQVPIPGKLRPPQDVRVWPPIQEGDSTQPFPALRATPLSSAPSWSTASPPPTATPPSGESSPGDPGQPGQPPSAESPQEETAPSPRRTARRTALLGVGAVLSVGLAVGLPSWFGYHVYRYAQPSDQVQLVQPGQAGTWQHVSWRATLEKTSDPEGNPGTSDRQWMRAVITRTALDREGAIRHGAPEVRLTDKSGRLWLMEEISNETPPDTEDNQIGVPYRIELIGVVPPSVADEVEILLRPSIARSVPGQSVEDMMKEAVKSEEKPDHVLRFLR